MPNYYIYGGINMRKVLAIVLAIVMALSLSVSAFAKEIEVFNNPEGEAFSDLVNPWDFFGVGGYWGREAANVLDITIDEVKQIAKEGGATFTYVFTGEPFGSDGPNLVFEFSDPQAKAVFQVTDLGDGKYEATASFDELVAAWEANGKTIDEIGNLLVQPNYSNFKLISATITTAFACEIDGTGYDSLEDAIENAVDGDTIVLTSNCECESVTIPAGVTLELNGNTLTGDVTVSAGAGLTVAEGDTLDGNVTVDVADFDAFVADTKVTISGGEITGTFPSLDEIVAAYNSSVTGYEPAATLGLYLGWGSDQNVTVAAPGAYTLTWQGEEKGWDWLILKSGDGPDATAIPEGTVIRTTEILINGDKIAFTNDAEYIDYTVTADGKVENKYFFPNAFGGGGALGEKPTDLGNASSVSVTFIVDPDNYKTEDEIKAEVLGAVSITGGKFTTADIEDYLGDDYVVDGEGNVTPAPSAPIIVTNGDNTPIECDTMEDALANVQENGKITLLSSNVEVDKMVNLNKAGVTLDLGGNTLTASESFTYTDRTNLNDAHVVNISADNVKVCNGTIKSTVNNKHCLNVYQATGVVVEGLTLDHTNANAIKGGAPMVVGGSDVTVKYMLETITGANSWYGINVDTYAGLTSSLKFDANAQMIFSGTNPVGIYLESTRSAESGDTVNVTFGENVSITAPEGVDFIAVFVNRESTGANNITVTNPENAGLKDNGDGTFEVKPVGTSNKYKITGCVYLNEDYHALIVNGRFIAQPHVDNGTGFCTACKGAINK